MPASLLAGALPTLAWVHWFSFLVFPSYADFANCKGLMWHGVPVSHVGGFLYYAGRWLWDVFFKDVTGFSRVDRRTKKSKNYQTSFVPKNLAREPQYFMVRKAFESCVIVVYHKCSPTSWHRFRRRKRHKLSCKSVYGKFDAIPNGVCSHTQKKFYNCLQLQQGRKYWIKASSLKP
jgi:hypothetical protein